MSKTVQNINDIAPMEEAGAGAGSNDPVQAEYHKGRALLERGETGPAAVALHNALVGFEEKGNDNGIANACNQLGIACLQRGDHEQAAAHFRRAEEICRNLDDRLSLVALAKQFIIVHTELGEYPEALERCLDLLDYYHGNNDPQGAIAIMEKMAEVYIRSGEVAKAADAYRTIASIHKNFRHDNLAGKFAAKAAELEEQGPEE